MPPVRALSPADSQDEHLPHILPADAARRSDAISIARVICILGVIYVHAWTGRNGIALDALRGTPQETLRWVLMEALGRSAVPLLGLISGWLVAGSARTRNFSSHIGRKARTILLPMVLWNALAILLVSGMAWLGTLSAPLPHTGLWVVEELFILTRNPDINVQMPFLRDLFLCMVAAPLMVRLPSWILLMIAAIAALCHIWGLGPPVLMRASILCFFALGMVARRVDLAERVAALPLLVAAIPFAILMPLRLMLALHVESDPSVEVMAALDLIARIAAAIFFWRLSWALAGSVARGMLLRVEPYAFFLFCAHLIVIWLGGPVLGAVFGRLGTPLYPIYLLTQPLLILGVVVLFGLALQRLWPAAANILSGGRLSAR